jgi:outer membrane protein assembly factor BamB
MKMNRRQYLVATAGTLLCTGCLSNTQLPDYDTAPGSFRPLGDAIWEYELPNTLGPVTVGEDLYVATQSELIRISASGTVQWATEFPSGLSNYPRKFDLTVCEDAIYAWLPSASRTNDVTAFNASSGEQQWTQTIDHNDRQFIGTTDGAVYMSSTSSEEGAVTGEVIALEDDTGDKRWQQEKGSDLGSVASHGLCIVSSPVDGLTAFDTGTGEVQWDKEISGDRGARLLVIDDILCVGRENTVTGYSLPEGTELWQSGAGGQIEPTVPGDTHHPHLYILEKDEDLTALNPTTGETRWKVDRDWNRVGSSGIVLSQNSVLYYSEVGLTNHDASTGEQRWGYTLDSNSSFRGPFIVDGVVFIVTHRGSENPVVRGFDAETGRRQWRTRLESTTELPFVGGIFDEYAVLMTDTYLYGMRVRSR